MTQRPAPTGEKHQYEGQVIPFRQAEEYRRRSESVVAIAAADIRARTLRPVDVVLLLPVIAPLTVTILLGLLGWFVAWLAVVGLLVISIVFADLARAVQWRLYGAAIQRLDPHVIGGR